MAMISAIEELKASKADLAARFSSGELRENYPEIHAEAVDQYFRRSLQESATGRCLFTEGTRFAFVALGGYGRKELCLHSDVDILFLFKDKVPARAEDLTAEILYPLWDLGLDLGHSTRGLKDCLTLASQNFEVLTSLMDGRFLCGDSPLYLDLLKLLMEKSLPKKTAAFVRWLEERHERRRAAFGDASFLLEPDIKEAVGGLRDYHQILWLGRALFHALTPKDLEYNGIFSHREYDDLDKSVRFIILVRNHLHRLSERKNDRLTFDHQETIARILGFQDQENMLSVEGFLGRLHAQMATVKSLHRCFVLANAQEEQGRRKRVEGNREVSLDSATDIVRDPLVMMEIFVESCRHGLPLSLETKRLIREFAPFVDDAFRRSERAVEAFLLIMNHPRAFETLDQMLEVGFLGALVPEFEGIRNRIQYDAYHLYPVDRHALETLRHLKSLGQEKNLLLLASFSDLSDPEPLFLAGLFHDIGKAGKDHEQKGVLITRAILKRMGYDSTRAETVLFLVAHHLLLAETASRRDLNDEKIIVQCASTVGTIERLKMLFLLTWADGRATGPRAWNAWIENLVLELFFKILHTLERGELASPDATRRVRQSVQRVREELGERIDRGELELFFEVMPPRYLLERKPKEIVGHIRRFKALEDLSEAASGEPFSLEGKEGFPQGTHEVTFIGKDRPGLFADLAGVMALHNINILSAQIYTWRDGTVVDIFQVTSPLDPLRCDEIWARLQADLKRIFSGALPLAERLQEKSGPSVIFRQKKWHWQPEVMVDNKASDFFTLVEVFAEDRVGLLHQITRTLSDLGLDIRIAKIATKKGRVADIFYVRDLEGQKVTEAGKVSEIQEALLQSLKQGS